MATKAVLGEFEANVLLDNAERVKEMFTEEYLPEAISMMVKNKYDSQIWQFVASDHPMKKEIPFGKQVHKVIVEEVIEEISKEEEPEFINNTTIKIPKKYQHMLEEVDQDDDGYWAYAREGYIFPEMGCRTAHEYTQKDLLAMIRTLQSETE